MTVVRMLAVAEPGMDPEEVRPAAEAMVAEQASAWSELVFVGASRDFLPDSVAAENPDLLGYLFECDAKPKA
jgi:hypothetical protein